MPLFISLTKRKPRLIPCQILVNTVDKSAEDEYYKSESEARENLNPTFVDGFIPANQIVGFYASHEFPHQTIVHSGNECLCVKIEVGEFEKLYNLYIGD